MTRREQWVVVVLIAIGIAAAVIAWLWLRQPALPEGILEGHGRIEVTEVTVSSKITGRIAEIRVGEGERVAEGALIARIEAADIEAQVAQARARVAAAAKQITLSRARLVTARHHRETSRQDYARMQDLFRGGAISRQSRDQAEDRMREAEGEFEVAQAQAAAAQAELEAAEAAAAQARSSLEETTVSAPVAGVVLNKAAERGELVVPGRAIVVLGDLDRPYLRVYLSGRDVGKVKRGDPARIYVDAFPGRPFTGVVSEIAKEAEFTPRDVHVPDERVTLVYGVKLQMQNPEGLLTPGMPADAYIRWKPEAPWPG